MTALRDIGGFLNTLFVWIDAKNIMEILYTTILG
jgi:hypothetical protein